MLLHSVLLAAEDRLKLLGLRLEARVAVQCSRRSHPAPSSFPLVRCCTAGGAEPCGSRPQGACAHGDA